MSQRHHGRLLPKISKMVSSPTSPWTSPTWGLRTSLLDGEMPTALLDQVWALLDAKKLSCGRTNMGLIPEGDLDSPATRAKLPAEVRAAKVTKNYYKVARKLNQK